MNYTETFEQFSSKLSGTDLALYAGAAIVLFVLFKDKIVGQQSKITNLLDRVKSLFNKNKTPLVVVPEVKPVTTNNSKEDIFFQLVVSWKQTRDLAVQSNCLEAVKVADQMFPYLSPSVCNKKEEVVWIKFYSL